MKTLAKSVMMLAVVAASVSFASCGTSAADKAKADSIAAAAKADSIAAAEEAAAAAAAAAERSSGSSAKNLPTLPLLRNKFGRPAREASFAE